MADKRAIQTAIGQALPAGKAPRGLDLKFGTPPVVLQTQAYAYIPLETPEQLKQWEADMRNFYGVSVDASRLSDVRACETCSCGCSDDSGFF